MEVKAAAECTWVGDRGLFGLVVACPYTYHSFLEITEPSV